MTVLRGDVYYADLNPVVGSEQGGIRPVLVIQNDKGNEHSPTVIVAAITSRKKNHLPTHIPLYSPSMLEKASMVLLEQIRTIDKRRLTEYIGKLGKPQMRKVDQALMISLGIDGE
jgi:mRNA interferase MazF